MVADGVSPRVSDEELAGATVRVPAAVPDEAVKFGSPG